MSIAPTEPTNSENIVTTAAPSEAKHDDDPKPVRPKRRRKSTSHLKAVPETLELRLRIKEESELLTKSLDNSKPFLKDELEQHSRQLLKQMELPEKYLGFSMVLIGNFFWKRQFLAVPYERRLLLLPHCLKHAEGCPADYDEFGLDCEKCGACSIADYKVRAEQLGYKVLVAEGSPIVLKIILAGYVDGILGVACLNVLEKAIDKVLLAGVPSYAIPLHSGDCKNTSLDESWVWDVLEKYEPLSEPQTTSYVPLMRAANKLFDEEFESLLPAERTKSAQAADSPLGKTEAMSYDWLTHGGKRFRPFITLAAYDALSGAHGLNAGISAETSFDFPDSVKRAAMAIEAFHKASLVHDDIQDDDQFRYGRETLHRRYGTGVAINVGDYLIGVGYRLVNSIRSDLGSDVSSDVLEKMAAAHVKLCDGQGAEMAWHESGNLNVSPLDALQIYALKTAPAFEAALFAGLRMAGPVKQYEEMIPAFSRHVGVGFQILNDLKDWHEDDNKLVAGQDALAFRPTVLLALALQSATDEQRQEIEQLMGGTARDGRRIGRLRQLFEECDVFETAEALVDKSRARAEALADEVEPDELRHLLYFLVDSILAPLNQPVPVDSEVLVPLTISGISES